jgi:hypothetical protein
MQAMFRSKEDACSYYDRHNPHMRGLNAHEHLKVIGIQKQNYFI